MKSNKESAYDWAEIPEDLNPKNLVLITAKTPHPTFHKESVEYPVRLFTSDELLEASRSLAHRPIGINHLGIIEGAFTVDAQYNKSTGNTEALCFFPNLWIDKVRTLIHEGKQSIFSVKYSWRKENFTESGVEFIGLIFDQVDLLCGVNAGDKYTSAQLVESEVVIFNGSYTNRHALTEAEAEYIGADKIQQENYKPENDEAFFKECECDYGKLAECDVKLYECMYVDKQLGEPFAGYKDFAACKAANKDKGNPDAYCGYIKHKVEDKKATECGGITHAGITHAECGMEHGPVVEPETLAIKQQGTESVAVDEHLEGEPVSVVRTEDQNPNKILGTDVKPLPRQRPEETNLLNNEPQQGISNQDPPVVEKPVMNVMSAGFVDDSHGKGPTSIIQTAEGGKPEWDLAQHNKPQLTDENKMVTNQETGVRGSMGAPTEIANPIKEMLTGLKVTPDTQKPNKEANPIDTGLKKVDGPQNQNTSYNYESETLTESNTESKVEPKVEPKIEPKIVVGLDPKLLEAEKKLTESAATIATLEARVKELEPIVNKLQEAAKTYESTVKLAEIKGRKEGKQELINKVKKVLPPTSMVSGNLQGCYRVLINDINKKLYESEREIT